MRLLFLIFISISLFASGEPLKKVSLQLVWLDQFQFAGYYMAKEKGFYKDAGLDVEIKKFQKGMNTFDEVTQGRATYGIGRPSSILYDPQGEKVTLLAAIFQSSPNVLISLESSNIKSVKDFKGRRLMQTKDLIQSASMIAMLQACGIYEHGVEVVDHTYDLNDLIEKKVDIYSGYSSNEPYALQTQGIKYRVFAPKKEGFDFYSDFLITSQKNVKLNFDEVQKFKEASIKGWDYAFSHIDESVEIILQKYNQQNKTKDALIFEANELKRLSYVKIDTLGTIDEGKIEYIYSTYKLLGLTNKPLNLLNLVFHEGGVYFNKVEREYIKNHSTIRYCTQPSSMPYSAIENAKLVGVGSGIVNLIAQKTNLNLELVPTASWKESIQKAIKRECDILPIAVETPSRRKYFNFTTPYYSEPLVIVTKKNEHYILDINTIMDKKFAIVEGNSFIELLKKKYPSIQLFGVKSLKEGFAAVERGEYYGAIDILMSSAYTLQHNSNVNLKIAGQFPEYLNVSFAVRNDDPVLHSILEKVVKSSDKESIQQILNKWISVNYTKSLDLWYFKYIFTIIGIFVLFLLYREYFLNKKNKELKELQDELLELNHTLESRVDVATSDLEKAQEVTKTGSWIFDLKTNELRWSKQTYKIFEVEQDTKDNLYERFREKIDPRDLEVVEKSYADSLANQSRYSISHRLLMDDGSIKYVNEECETLFSDDGSPLISYGTVQDISEHVKLETEIKKKDALMLHQSRLAQMGEMLSMIAHQWKQPLSTIGAIGINIKVAIDLHRYNLEEVQGRTDFFNFLQKNLDRIALHVQNLSEVIENFSAFYKPNKHAELLTLDAVVMKSYSLLKGSFGTLDIQVSFDLNSKTLLKVYENELIQVCLNIVTNAKEQFMQNETKNPYIDIRTYEKENVAYLEIEDNAGGVKEDIIEYVFDPYFSTKYEKNGTGLGLHMSKIIINQYHNGTLSVRNAENGAIFTISLPLEQ
jgi:ABC-type nitrate/sulfonate/bicarbonate transport system substrate-binding protein/C4-dicarboxylate-specific signal transduction histidine kinase